MKSIQPFVLKEGKNIQNVSKNTRKHWYDPLIVFLQRELLLCFIKKLLLMMLLFVYLGWVIQSNIHDHIWTCGLPFHKGYISHVDLHFMIILNIVQHLHNSVIC